MVKSPFADKLVTNHESVSQTAPTPGDIYLACLKGSLNLIHRKLLHTYPFSLLLSRYAPSFFVLSSNQNYSTSPSPLNILNQNLDNYLMPQRCLCDEPHSPDLVELISLHLLIHSLIHIFFHSFQILLNCWALCWCWSPSGKEAQAVPAR